MHTHNFPKLPRFAEIHFPLIKKKNQVLPTSWVTLYFVLDTGEEEILGTEFSSEW